MTETKLDTTQGVLKEIESAVDMAKADKSNIELASLRLRGCKHAIQIMALAVMSNRNRGLIGSPQHFTLNKPNAK